MQRLFVFFFFSFVLSQARGQADYLTLKDFPVTEGKVLVAHYAENIYKIVYQPAGYLPKELVSDAVILRRPPMMGYPFEANVSGDTVYIRNRPVLTGFVSDSMHKGFNFPLQPGEKVFGGGERALPLNRRGYRLNLYNNPWYGYSEGADNLNYSVPFLTSSEGYGLYFDNPSKGYLDIGKEKPDQLKYATQSGELNVFVIFGSYPQILQSFHKLTGTQPLPPRWAFGNLMSRFGYTSEAQVKDIYAKMKREKMPVDAIIYDLFWFGDSVKGTMGNLNWVNTTKWPDPKRMIADFKKEGVQTILVTEPYFVETSNNYKAALPYFAVDSTGKPFYLEKFFFGKGGLVDIFRKDAQLWFWQFYKKQMLMGVESWWGDLGEPENHPAGVHHNLKDMGHSRLFRADEVHNLYGHTWTKMLYQNYAREFPNKRLFSLNRAGFAGSQRFGIFPWTGDVSRSWSGFRAQLPILLGMSMSGVPYVHSDAGGFAGGEGDAELYVRWLQFACFTPIFRPHGTGLFEVEPTAFSYPSEPALIDSNYRPYARRAVWDRYALMPYNYSLAYQQTIKGKPLMAPLYYHFPDDTAAAGIQDEYMWGDNILVAPVLEKGARQRKYYLPAGKWFHPGSFNLLEGNKWYTDKVGIGDVVRLYREGGFIPMTDFPKSGRSSEVSNSTGNGHNAIITYVESDQPSSFEWYNDDGHSKNSLSAGQYELITLSSPGKTPEGLTISLRSNKGSYTGRPARRTIRLMVVSSSPQDPQQIMINNQPLTAKSVAGSWEKNTYVATGNGILLIDFEWTTGTVDIRTGGNGQ
jgi:oligosaccharide 4-alpha-D-glucosyltransferase